MRAIELFAGVGGFRLGLERAGHEVVWSNEWDKYAAATYDKNFSGEIDRRDITKIAAAEIPKHDIICGGFPCQTFSVAGKRRGFEETRGTLFFDILRIARHHRTPYLLLENVKGLLNHEGGRTFFTILCALDESGYDCQWQVLNSKDFGVPQNRERVYIVGYLRGKSRPQVFPIGDFEPVGQTVHRRQNEEESIAPTLTASLSVKADGQFVLQDVRGLKKSQNGKGYKPTAGPSYTVDTLGTQGIAKTIRVGGGGSPHGSRQNWDSYEVDGLIRRLTPVECERLQGFPDNWTAGVSDTQRYRQMGNAVTVNVVEAVAKRLPV